MRTDPANIALLIKEGEGLTLEFKEHFTSRIDEDMVAFANTRGGVILLGVRDNGTVGGEHFTNDFASTTSTALPTESSRCRNIMVFSLVKSGIMLY